jgi:hypothetical protein
MRKPIEQLARDLANAPREATLIELSDAYCASIERVMDALAVLKILRDTKTLEQAPITYVKY